MRYLLDTHVLIWIYGGSDRLSPTVKSILSDESNALSVSVASLWEFAIKHSKGKLHFEGGLERLYTLLELDGIDIISIEQTHLIALIQSAFTHLDPFDRVIMATAKSENLILLTTDKKIQHSDIRWLW